MRPMLQYSERLLLQQKCDFFFFFWAGLCVRDVRLCLMGTRGTVSQGTLGTAVTCPEPRPALGTGQPWSLWLFPLFLSSPPSSPPVIHSNSLKAFSAPGAPGGSLVSLLWAGGSELLNDLAWWAQPGWRRNQQCPIRALPIWHNPGVALDIPMKTDFYGNLVIPH